jgi:hypothetical protein
LLTLLLPALSGCAGKSRTQARVHRAYLAGQREAETRMQQQLQQQQQQAAQVVTFVGEVKNPILIWSADLMLSQAIVDADYAGATDPVLIVVHRADGQEINITPQQLLNGEDVLLQAGDIVQIQQ